MKDSKIAWTHHTFNPWWGCVKVSPGCKNCYAETFAKRTGNQVWGVDAPRRFFGQKHWNEPMKWNTWAVNGTCYSCGGRGWKSKGISCDTCAGLGNIGPYRARVFCASMADVFETHRNKDTQAKMDDARYNLAKMIVNTPSLDWLLLTKRIENAYRYLLTMYGEYGYPPPNLWIGTTCENQEQAEIRVPHLLEIPASVRFISAEPQLSHIGFNATKELHNAFETKQIDWVICGGESGPGCRPFNVEWARSLRDQCKEAKIAFFMKQLGGHPKKNDQMDDLPEDLRIREFPR